VKRSDTRILTTHAGSLIRPRELVQLGTQARENVSRRSSEGAKAGAHDDRRYRDALARATADVVSRQVDAGVDVVNDGEYGKSSWSNYVLERLTGFEERPDRLVEAVWLGRDRIRFREFMKENYPRGAASSPGQLCVGPITYTGREDVRRNIADLKAALAGSDRGTRLSGAPAQVPEGFLTAVAPASTGYEAANEFYPSDADYVFAIADALREEYLEIVNAGLILQVDDAVLANMYDELAQQGPARYREWAEVRVEALNHALRDIPEEKIRYHICFGSWPVPHTADAALGDIVDLVLKVRAGAYSIEAANARHEHEWRVWQDVKLPAGRILIPGVVTHHTTTVEHPRLVADRIVRFAGLVGRENVIAGTDCGFAQLEGIQRVHPQVMWAKLEALAEGARIASRELWQ
jgi:5-methyltetrahydropteroyltriglutamate--homocysteine methyltransferase